MVREAFFKMLKSNFKDKVNFRSKNSRGIIYFKKSPSSREELEYLTKNVLDFVHNKKLDKADKTFLKETLSLDNNKVIKLVIYKTTNMLSILAYN